MLIRDAPLCGLVQIRKAARGSCKGFDFLRSLHTNPFRLGGTEAERNVIDLL